MNGCLIGTCCIESGPSGIAGCNRYMPASPRKFACSMIQRGISSELRLHLFKNSANKMLFCSFIFDRLARFATLIAFIDLGGAHDVLVIADIEQSDTCSATAQYAQ